MGILKNKLLVLITIISSLALIACDSNIPRSEEIVTDTSISISSFTVDSATLEQGSSAILAWDVSDDNDRVSYCYISPDVGTVAESGTKQVTPNQSTTYTLTTYVDNESHSSRSIQITVIGPDGSEVVDYSDPEICDDEAEADEDGDGLANCDDDDCSAEPHCEEDEVIEYELTLSVDPDSSDPDVDVLIGDFVTVSWDSNYSETRLVDETGTVSEKPYSSSGTYSFAISEENTSAETVEEDGSIYTVYTASVTVYGYNEYGVYQDEHSVSVSATAVPVTEEPDYSGRVSIFAEPYQSEIIYGQKFTFSWEASNYSSVYMVYSGYDDDIQMSYSGGESGQGSVIVDRATSSWSFDIYITDENYIERGTPYSTDFNINKFDTGPVSDLGSVKQLVPTGTDGTFYVVTADKIKKTEDYGNTFTDVEVKAAEETTLEGEYTGLGVSSSHFYLGTKNGLYMSAAGGGEFTQISEICDGCTVSISAIYPSSTVNGEESVIIGTEMALYKIYKASSSEIDGEACSAGYRMTNEYCAKIHKLDDSHQSEDDYANATHGGDPVNFIKFVPKLNSSSKAMLITQNHGTFYTEDSGATFSQHNITATDGYWKSGSEGFLWNKENNQAWRVNDGDFGQFSISDSHASVRDINFINKVGTHLFVATDNGIFFHNNSSDLDNGLWSLSNVTTATEFLFGQKVITSVMEGNQHEVTAFTQSGSSYQLQWTKSLNRLGAFGFGILNL